MIVNTAQGGGGYGTLSFQISNFYATIGNASVVLSWSNPDDSNFSGVLLVRKTGNYPSKPGDGTKVYDGTGTSYTDTGLTNGTQYYYRAFAYNPKKQYQTSYCVATMTPQDGYQLGTFPIGTKIKFGSIFGHPIVQKIANISGNNVTLITDGIIAEYAFDAAEPLNNNYANCKNYGNNRYIYSNIHQWLNSEAGAGAWYTAQHSVDHAPDSGVTNNAYASAAGFLNGFSTREKSCLKTQTITVAKPIVYGGGTETLNARIWLPSGTEIGITATGFTEGSPLSLSSDHNSMVAYETADCAAHCGNPNSPGYYWLRTPTSGNYDDSTVCLYHDGISAADANNGDRGVRPLCVLDSSILFSATVDADGCHTLI